MADLLKTGMMVETSGFTKRRIARWPRSALSDDHREVEQFVVVQQRNLP
jgi:hypothetical protein